MIGTMPIYDHRCDHCGHAFSVVRGYNDPPVEKCPNCGKKPRRVIAPPAIVFKGSGWYKTDSRAPSSEWKSETKPETKTETKTETSTKADTKPSESASTPATKAAS